MPEEEKLKKKVGRPRTRSPNKGGRPRSFGGKYDMYDPRVIEVLEKKARVFFVAAMGGSQDDCARAAGVCQTTISDYYGKEYYEGKFDLKMRIRYAQLMKAFEGDSNLLKHMGVVHCEEQKDAGVIDLAKQVLQSGIEKMTEKIEMDGGQEVTHEIFQIGSEEIPEDEDK